MAENDFNENVNSNEGGSFDLNSFSTVNKKTDDNTDAPVKTVISRKKKITTTCRTGQPRHAPLGGRFGQGGPPRAR